ncbi:hypothetical protein H6802_03780 [Candidatus Nomurabacteria bacterium]|uniref:Uncharacterized protein n=1 Tax=candidate division WWE3 bacterium TaxID=2053526 RepID=A0A955IWJ0_UNCKA|nr:hypothetical protein [candidate division WWE3 bacterium]MCB9824043.1 hypothetical protein [Candidatus Nomurabacteria bacterium]MCB9826986.1 hypothetical protein [Candidatus Nomurabacteria bacterium]MCB9827984.1 hypothetical protein [Candidatus Nomurabacteria bacterium]
MSKNKVGYTDYRPARDNCFNPANRRDGDRGRIHRSLTSLRLGRLLETPRGPCEAEAPEETKLTFYLFKHLFQQMPNMLNAIEEKPDLLPETEDRWGLWDEIKRRELDHFVRFLKSMGDRITALSELLSTERLPRPYTRENKGVLEALIPIDLCKRRPNENCVFPTARVLYDPLQLGGALPDEYKGLPESEVMAKFLETPGSLHPEQAAKVLSIDKNMVIEAVEEWGRAPSAMLTVMFAQQNINKNNPFGNGTRLPYEYTNFRLYISYDRQHGLMVTPALVYNQDSDQVGGRSETILLGEKTPLISAGTAHITQEDLNTAIISRFGLGGNGGGNGSNNGPEGGKEYHHTATGSRGMEDPGDSTKAQGSNRRKRKYKFQS